VEQMDQTSIEGWIMFRIGFYRPAFIFVVLAGYYSFLFKENVFSKEVNETQKKTLQVSGLLIIIYQIIFFDFNQPIHDVIAFLLIFLYFNAVYIPFMIASYKLYVKLSEVKYKKAILSLTFMSISFTLVFLFFLLDRVVIFLGGDNFSVFYFLGEFAVLSGLLFGYFGYIRPGEKKRGNK